MGADPPPDDVRLAGVDFIAVLEGRAGRAGRRLIADSVFTYVRHEERDWIVEQRFLEVDRATLSLERLVAELARYGQLHRAKVKGREEPLWRYSYPVFPPVICALTGASRAALARRRTMALTLLDRHPAVADNPNVAIYVCFLDELKDRGPYAPIFRKPEASDQAVNWLGQSDQLAASGAASSGDWA